jgi:hypothetical protein
MRAQEIFGFHFLPAAALGEDATQNLRRRQQLLSFARPFSALLLQGENLDSAVREGIFPIKGILRFLLPLLRRLRVSSNETLNPVLRASTE